MSPQKGEKKKKKKKLFNMDTLQEQRKNKKAMEFELKLAKEKEEMYEREKQLKINRLVQEVHEQKFHSVKWKYGHVFQQSLYPNIISKLAAVYDNLFLHWVTLIDAGISASGSVLMLLDSGSDPGFRDGERRPGGVREGAALGGTSLPDSAGTDHLCGERIPRGTGDDGSISPPRV